MLFVYDDEDNELFGTEVEELNNLLEDTPYEMLEDDNEVVVNGKAMVSVSRIVDEIMRENFYVAVQHSKTNIPPLLFHYRNLTNKLVLPCRTLSRDLSPLNSSSSFP